jgi:ABC-2 type transport system permease protein
MKIIDIAIKDMLRNFRSTFAIGMMFFVPLLITGLIYMAFSGGGSSGQPEMAATHVLVVNQDTPPAGSPDFGSLLLDTLNDPGVANLVQAAPAASESEAIDAVNNQKAGVAVIVPPGFTQAILSGTGRPEVRIVQDPTLSIGPMIVRNLVGMLVDSASGARIALQTSQQRSAALGLSPENSSAAILQSYQSWYTGFQRSLYNDPQSALVSQAPTQAGASPSQGIPNMKTILAMILSGMAIFFGFFTGAYSMMSILKEEEEGTLARLFSTPTSRTAILTGKFLAVLLMVTVQGTVMILAGIVLFQVDWGNALGVFLALIGQVLAATSLGVLLISLIKNTRQSGPVLGGVLSVLGMFGGLMTVAVTGMPPIFDTLALFTPQGWVLRSWKLTLAGAAPVDLLLPLVVLTGMSLVMFAVGATLFRRRFA